MTAIFYCIGCLHCTVFEGYLYWLYNAFDYLSNKVNFKLFYSLSTTAH